MTRLYLCLFIVIFAYCKGAPVEEKDGAVNEPLRDYVSRWHQLGQLYKNDKTFRASVRLSDHYHHMSQESQAVDDPRGPAVDIPSIPFNCDPALGVSPTKPTSVHALRPGDVNIVGALGDSFTAGNGIGAPFALTVILPNRGESFNSGADFDLEMNVTTVPNMIRKFNPNLKGAAKCMSNVDTTYYSQLNLAEAEARSDGLAAQASALVTRIRNDTEMDNANDWKMISMLVGGKDLCFFCENPGSHTPAVFKSNVKAALDILHQNLPRTFVNLIPMMDLSYLVNVTFNHPGTDYPGDPPPNLLQLLDPQDNLPTWYPAVCDIFQGRFCPCPINGTAAEEVQLQKDYFTALEELASSGVYDEDDFTVVLQPHFRDAKPIIDPLINYPDNRYFAPDCIHPNRRQHQIYAFALWNVMLTKVGQKPFAFDPRTAAYKCPTASDPYFFTSQNSL